MPTRSKFTSERRARILEVLGSGGSRRTAAAVAGIDHATLSRWIERGRKGSPLGRWRAFLRDVEEAEKHPQLRALTEEYDKAQDSPWAAWRYLERHNVWAEDDEPQRDPPDGPVVIRFTLAEENVPALGSDLDGEEATGAGSGREAGSELGTPQLADKPWRPDIRSEDFGLGLE